MLDAGDILLLRRTLWRSLQRHWASSDRITAMSRATVSFTCRPIRSCREPVSFTCSPAVERPELTSYAPYLKCLGVRDGSPSVSES